MRCTCCGCALDLSPGEECDYCGTVAYATMAEPPLRPKRDKGLFLHDSIQNHPRIDNDKYRGKIKNPWTIV